MHFLTIISTLVGLVCLTYATPSSYYDNVPRIVPDELVDRIDNPSLGGGFARNPYFRIGGPTGKSLGEFVPHHFGSKPLVFGPSAKFRYSGEYTGSFPYAKFGYGPQLPTPLVGSRKFIYGPTTYFKGSFGVNPGFNTFGFGKSYGIESFNDFGFPGVHGLGYGADYSVLKKR